MFKHRLRLPSPALAIPLIALFVALGGTDYAAIHPPKNSVGAKQLKKNAVTSSKIKSHAVTAAKINTSGLNVPNAVQATNATNAANAKNATNATNATNASNSADLGGVAASGYVQNAGNTFVSVGSSNWHSLVLRRSEWLHAGADDGSGKRTEVR